MGLLIDGVWTDEDTRTKGGRFERPASRFRSWVTADGSAGPSGEGGFQAEAGRYHLYVAHACPWAHRTVIFRKLKGLEGLVSLSVVSPVVRGEGWTFAREEGSTGDSLHGKEKLSEVYVLADPRYTGRVSVPALWDKKRGTIVNNESSEIIRMFNSAFDGLTGSNLDFYPADARAEIDAVNDLVYAAINNGVYRTGFSTTQEAYEEAFLKLFDALDGLEERLARQRYLVGDRVTEADWRLFTTLVRFDAVYFGHFKCNLRRIVDYPNLSNYLRDLYQTPGIAETVDIDDIKRHYYASHRNVNPTGIVPLGPALDFSAPHDRARLAG
jgi:glutathionyl-hydroquinone reductase